MDDTVYFIELKLKTLLNIFTQIVYLHSTVIETGTVSVIAYHLALPIIFDASIFPSIVGLLLLKTQKLNFLDE